MNSFRVEKVLDLFFRNLTVLKDENWSVMVKKYLVPFVEGAEIGPTRSRWMVSRTLLTGEKWLRKGRRVILQEQQMSHQSGLEAEGKSLERYRGLGCPRRRCQRHVGKETVETELHSGVGILAKKKF